MLHINSISVAPWPQQAASVKAQPVTTAKASNVVSKDSAGSAVSAAASGEVGRVQATFLPSALPPVNPVKEAVGADMLNNAAAPERSGEVASQVSAQVRSRGRSVVSEAAQALGAQPSSATGVANAASGDEASAKIDPLAMADAQALRANDSKQRPSPIGELPTDPKDPVVEAMETQIKELLPNLWKASRAAVDVLIGEEAKAAAAERAARFDEGMADAASAVAEMVAQEASESYKAQAVDAAASSAPGSRVSKLV
ncbi:MAG: hypothetical protein RI959_123 [Pseudomonadota bacterium]|jgi:hypothetical protein